ncbi:unnamed protein product [Blepharisma stoltei]|uniref:Uncharacterized protein n=1 Tax=Blepharisma stoltei TaxID=1481888 RepID=A0AAU9IM85_9CILI|nr:unnamed protein product [Blepharisma stoltei]
MMQMLIRGFKSSPRLLMKKDYYKILGVSPSATDPEIKKAYFILAKKFHPDVCSDPSAKEKFSEINEAYETIANSQKRNLYNASRKENNTHKEEKVHEDPENIFEGFEDFNFQGSFSQFEFNNISLDNNQEKKQFKGDDIKLAIEVPFLEAIHGISRVLKFERRTLCNACHGSKMKIGTARAKCEACQGKGVISVKKDNMNVQVMCQKCKGVGNFIRALCLSCRGRGILSSKATEAVRFPSGVDDGFMLRMLNKGHHSELGGPPGDLQVWVKVLPSPTYKRQGYDIHTNLSLSVTQAVLGAEIEVDTIHGKTKIQVNPGTNPGDTHRIVGQGIKYLPPSTLKGHHFVEFNIKIPKKLTSEQRSIFEQLEKVKSKTK